MWDRCPEVLKGEEDGHQDKTRPTLPDADKREGIGREVTT